jgi:large subunit ribosomal protein L9
MKVVFFQDIEGTALVGDVKDVKNGFARNYLLPRGLAGPTTPDNMQHANSLAEKEARRQAKLDDAAIVQRDRLEGYTVSLDARVGETGRLYGSITNRDIAAKIEETSGIEVDPHVILLPEPIRDLGAQDVTITFTRNISVDINVEVVPDEESKPIVEQLLAQKAEEEAAVAKAEEEAAAAAVAEEASEGAEAEESAGEDESVEEPTE